MLSGFGDEQQHSFYTTADYLIMVRGLITSQVGHTRCVVRVQLLVLLEDSRTSSCSDSLSLIVSHAIHCWSHKSELRQVLCHGFLATQQRSIDATKNLYIITQQPGLLSSSSGYLSLYSASSLARSAGVLR
jgi:hypothetical protein